MRPNRSVEIPPTNPAGAPRRAMPTAILRQEPPTTGASASRPSVEWTARKSIRASPQLNSMGLTLGAGTGGRFDAVHDGAAFAIQRSHQGVNPPLGPVEIRYCGRGRLAAATDRRHRGHRL